MTDRIVSHPVTQEYRDNFDRIFGKPFTLGNYIDMCVEALKEGNNSPELKNPAIEEWLHNGCLGLHSEPRLNDQDTA